MVRSYIMTLLGRVIRDASSIHDGTEEIHSERSMIEGIYNGYEHTK